MKDKYPKSYGRFLEALKQVKPQLVYIPNKVGVFPVFECFL